MIETVAVWGNGNNDRISYFLLNTFDIGLFASFFTRIGICLMGLGVVATEGGKGCVVVTEVGVAVVVVMVDLYQLFMLDASKVVVLMGCRDATGGLLMSSPTSKYFVLSDISFS